MVHFIAEYKEISLSLSWKSHSNSWMAYPHSQMNSKPLWRTSFILNTCKPQDKVNDVFNCAQNKYVQMSLKILVMHSAMRFLHFFFRCLHHTETTRGLPGGGVVDDGRLC
jgi:hypothetical protein